MTSQRQVMAEAVPVERNEHREAILSFLATKGLTPTVSWLNDFLQQPRSNVPLSSLQQTALYRLLTTDITTSVQTSASNVLPNRAADPMLMEQRFPGPVVLQLLDIEDIGSSSWSQVEAIEAQERGESTRGHQVIRTLPDENGETPATRSKGPHKLLLQDPAGTKVYAFETKPIEKIELGCAIGLKLSLKNATIARGLLLLNPTNTVVLGGKIETADRAWHAERKQRLLQKVTNDE